MAEGENIKKCGTGVVPAASSCGADPPHAFELCVVPASELIAAQSVGRQVADVEAGKLMHEVGVGHPSNTREEKKKKV